MILFRYVKCDYINFLPAQLVTKLRRNSDGSFKGHGHIEFRALEELDIQPTKIFQIASDMDICIAVNPMLDIIKIIGTFKSGFLQGNVNIQLRNQNTIGGIETIRYSKYFK